MALFDFLPSRKRQKQKSLLIQASDEFIRAAKERGGLEPMPTNIFLAKGERAFLETEDEVPLMETRAIRRSSRGGVGLRIAKGVYVGTGSGTSESHDEWRAIDNGVLTLTNQRLVFDGSQQNRVVPLSKLISVQPWRDAIEVSVASRKKSMLFSVDNPFLWTAAILIVSNAENPEELAATKISISFE